MKNRKVEITIHDYDVWNMDGTLAMIILPMLYKIKEKKQGSPFVDDEDVPVELQSVNAKPKENTWDIDEFFHDRWTWVLSEMIWVFEQISQDGDDESAILIAGGNMEGLDKHRERKNNSLCLFGKYFQCLWT